MRRSHALKIILLLVLLALGGAVITVNQYINLQSNYWGGQATGGKLWLSLENSNVISVDSYRNIVGKVISVQPVEQQEVTIGYSLKLWIPETSEEVLVHLGTKLTSPAYIFLAGKDSPQALNFHEFISQLNLNTNISATLLINPHTGMITGMQNIIIQPDVADQ